MGDSVEITSLRQEWQNQQEHIGRMQNEICNMRKQLSMQSKFFSQMGSTLGLMLWNYCKDADINLILKDLKTLKDLLEIVDSLLKVYVKCFQFETHPIFKQSNKEMDELKLILALIGVVTNITTHPEGRIVILQEEFGLRFVKSIISTYEQIKKPHILQRTVLMMITNISMNQKGVTLFLSNVNYLVTLIDTVNLRNHPEIISLGLNAINNVLTANIPEEVLESVVRKLPTNQIESLTTTEYTDISRAATLICEQIAKINA